MSIMRFLAAPLIGVLLLLTSAATVTAQQPDFTAAERAQFRQKTIAAGGPFTQVIMEIFPAEWTNYETRALTADRKGDKAEKERLVEELIMPLMRRVFEGWNRAPTPVLVEMYESRIATLQRLPPDICVAMVATGLSTDQFNGLTPALREAVNQWLLDLANAASAGRKTPVPHPDPSPAQLDVARQSFLRLGGDPDWFDAFADGKEGRFADAANCRNRGLWMEAVVVQPPEAAARIIAY